MPGLVILPGGLGHPAVHVIIPPVEVPGPSQRRNTHSRRHPSPGGQVRPLPRLFGHARRRPDGALPSASGPLALFMSG